MPPASDKEDLFTLRTIRLKHDVAPGTVVLRILHDGIVTTRTLPTGQDLVIGRSSDCDVHIPHGSISRRHTVIRIGRATEVEDLGSANGTRVGDRLLGAGQRAVIATGSVFQLGSVMIVFHSTPVADPNPTAATSTKPVSTKSELVQLVERVAASDVSVLLTGETGVGKEVTSELIHRLSPRARGPFVRLNCAAFSEALLASEIFGHEKGAFSGADRTKPGLFEVAEGGTVLLDEVGELPLALQAKFLRVLEERSVLRVGGLHPRSIDVRFISATNRDLQHEVAEGRFRADLYFRLDTFSIVIPPLRERRSEIPELTRRFLEEFARKLGRSEIPRLSAAALETLEGYSWPGNIRELRNVVERAVLLCEAEIGLEHLPLDKMRRSAARSPASGATESLQEQLLNAERDRIMATLAQCGGNQTQAAKVLGISRNTLAAQIERLGLPRPRKR